VAPQPLPQLQEEEEAVAGEPSPESGERQAEAGAEQTARRPVRWTGAVAAEEGRAEEGRLQRRLASGVVGEGREGR
jgi:hypothetical protein